MKILENLNHSQIEAVTTVEGPLFISAGAGSGKTRALTNRIAYMIYKKGIDPTSILAVTFTNKAASEMRERVGKLSGILFQNDYSIPKNAPLVGTFHSICVKILRCEIEEAGMKKDFVIYDTSDTKSLMKQILKDFQIDEKEYGYKKVLYHISNAKNELITPDIYTNYADTYFKSNIAKLYREYQNRLLENNALDFDDIIMLTILILSKEKELLSYYQDRWRYISVDEYQDTNYAQYILVNMLAKKHKNICVIGDSDQSIYSFRGADIRNILNFTNDYPNAKVIKLEQNYRSTKNILDAADSIISKNTKRVSKRMWTERGEGDKIAVYKAKSEKDEANKIVMEIQNIVRNSNRDLSDFVILYRTNAQSRPIEEAMLAYAIPYKIFGGLKFYARKEIKDILAYLRVINNYSDQVSVTRIINVPGRKIGKTTVDKLFLLSSRENINIFEIIQNIEQYDIFSSNTKKHLKDFRDLIRDLIESSYNINVSLLIKNIIDLSGYSEMLLTENTEDSKTRLENIFELISVARKYQDLETRESLVKLLEEIALITDIDSFSDKNDMVTLMTTHTVKGLEFSYVFIVGVEENLFPHYKSMDTEDQLEEERRLMYVAITRAKEKLYLLYADYRLIFGEFQKNPVSRFLTDIPLNLQEILNNNTDDISVLDKDLIESNSDGFDCFDFNQDH